MFADRRKAVLGLLAAALIASPVILSTPAAASHGPCGSEPACVVFVEGQKLGDLIVPGLIADEDSPVLATVDIGEAVLRVDVGPTYVSQRLVLAQINGEPTYEGTIGPAQFEESTGWCDEADPQGCVAYLVEPGTSEEYGEKVGELWLDRVQIWGLHALWTDAPILRVR